MFPKRFAWFAVATLAAGLLAAGLAACGGETEAAQDCEPGTEVFCKCQANLGEGTKRCRDDGASFEECITPDGACSELEPTTTGQGGAGTNTDCRAGQQFACTCENGEDGTQTCNDDGDALGVCSTEDGPCGSGEAATSGTGGSGGGSRLLFEPCGEASECKSDSCEMGFCTKECGNFSECADDGGIQGECARFAGGTLQVCAPYCEVQSDCLDAYGEPSACGFGVAPDDPGYGFAVCGDWEDELSPLPEGLDCADDLDCSLGIPGAERVCSFEACIAGCFEDFDCPGSDLCSSDGSVPGSCF